MSQLCVGVYAPVSSTHTLTGAVRVSSVPATVTDTELAAVVLCMEVNNSVSVVVDLHSLLFVLLKTESHCVVRLVSA